MGYLSLLFLDKPGVRSLGVVSGFFLIEPFMVVVGGFEASFGEIHSWYVLLDDDGIGGIFFRVGTGYVGCF